MKPTGGQPQVTPIPPPVSLFPGITGGLNANGAGLGNTLATTLQNITSGTDFNKIVKTITESNAQQTTQGTAALKESFASSGMGSSTNMMQAIGNYRQGQQASLNDQILQAGFKAEELQLGGAQMLSQFATSFAPRVAVTQGASGPSIFSQGSSAGQAAAMMLMMAMAA